MAGTVALQGDEQTAGRTARRRVTPRPVLPSGRAMVGGLLLAVAVVGTFTTWRSATGGPGTSYVVARRALQPGDRLAADDVGLAPAELTSAIAGRSFASADAVVGRVVLGPISENELLQRSQLGESGSARPHVEVSFALPRDRAVDGRLRSGDRVDVFATYDDHTAEVVRGAQVVGVGGDPAASLAGDMQVTVTLALDDGTRRAELVHAVRAGEVTLVRSTQSDESTDGAEVFQPDGAPTPARGDG
jgi:Flp pilus assembly protein CpaB